jgi:hypothetical protein
MIDDELDVAPPQARAVDVDKLYPRPLPERKGEFHSWSAAESAARQREADLSNQLGMDPAARERLYKGYRDLERVLPAGLAATLTDADIDTRLAAGRFSPDPDADTVAVGQRTEAWSIESRERITSLYGQKDGEALLARTNKWVKSQPAVAQIVRQRGIGSRPDIVEQLVAHVFSNGLGR